MIADATLHLVRSSNKTNLMINHILMGIIKLWINFDLVKAIEGYHLLWKTANKNLNVSEQVELRNKYRPLSAPAVL